MKLWRVLMVAALWMGSSAEAASEGSDETQAVNRDWERNQQPGLRERVAKALEGKHDALEPVLGLAQLGSGVEALPLLEEAILLAPTDPFSHFLLGVTLQGTWDGRLALPLEQRDYARAEVALKRARELEPLNGLYDLFLIENLQLQGRIDEAVTALEALKGARKFQFDWTRLFNMQVKAAALAGIQDDQTLEKLWNTASILLYLPMRDLMASAFPEPGAADRDDISRYEARKEGIVHIARLMDQGNVPVIGWGGCTRRSGAKRRSRWPMRWCRRRPAPGLGWMPTLPRTGGPGRITRASI